MKVRVSLFIHFLFFSFFKVYYNLLTFNFKKQIAQIYILAALMSLACAMPQDAAKPPVAIISSESEGPDADGNYNFK